MSVFLGIDVGTSGTKTIAIDQHGKILADATAGYPAYHPKPLWSEQDPEDWWQATIATVRQVMHDARIKPGRVRAIGLSGQMHGSVFLDKNDRVVRRAILWNDQRTAAECVEIEQRAGGRKNLIKMVANPALTGFTAPKILWLRNHEPRNFDRTRKILLPKDDIRRRLTGEYATEVSDASGTLLLDIAKRDWSTRLLRRLELDRQLLPECYESEDVTGQLTSAAAETLGLTTDCLVVGGAGDCAAGAVGNGIVKRGLLTSSLGTSGVMFVHSDEMQFDPQGRLHTFCHAVRGKWHMMGVNLSAAGSLEWFCQQLCPELSAASQSGNRQSRKPTAADPYQVLTDEAGRSPAGSEGLFFLPYLAGERTPHADPNARGCFIGLTLKHTRGHLVRSIMEGVVYALNDSLQIIRQLGVPVREIRAGGGGAKSELWRQIQASVFAQKVVRINAEQGPAFGVALLAAVGAGHYRNIQEACAAHIHTVDQTLPDRSARRRYAERFPIYQQLYRSLRDDFQRISQLD